MNKTNWDSPMLGVVCSVFRAADEVFNRQTDVDDNLINWYIDLAGAIEYFHNINMRHDAASVLHSTLYGLEYAPQDEIVLERYSDLRKTLYLSKEFYESKEVSNRCLNDSQSLGKDFGRSKDTVHLGLLSRLDKVLEAWDLMSQQK
jgi:hypothetical protein